jgi:dephospho-CoA kinase
MLLVGLTGNIASGKSEVARRLERLGATVIDADRLARLVVEPGTPALAEIVARWGPRVIRADGSLDRQILRDIVFADAAERDVLERIVHPRIEAVREALLDEARRRGDRIVVCDIPLLFERGLESRFDCVVFVDAPDATRLARLRARRELDDATAQRMMAAQLPPGPKRHRAHFVVSNASSLARLDDEVEALWAALQERAR